MTEVGNETLGDAREAAGLPRGLFSEEYRLPSGSMSASVLSLYEACPWRYRSRKVDKLDRTPTDDSRAQSRGKLVHRVLEIVGRPRLWTDEVVTRTHLKRALEDAVAEGLALDAGAHKDAWDLLRPLGGRLTFRTTLAVEEPFQSDLGDGLGLFVGIIDRIDRVVDAGRTWLQVGDYKTGAYVPSVAELEEDPQVMGYLAHLHDISGATDLRMKVHYLAKGISQTVEWTPDLQDRAWDYVRGKVREIAAAREFPALVGRACHECEFANRCDARAAELRSEKRGLVVSILGGPHETLLPERQRLKALEEFYAGERRRVDERLVAECAGGRSAIGGGLRASLVAKTKESTPGPWSVAEELGRVLDPGDPDGSRDWVFSRIAGTDPRKLDDLLKTLGDKEAAARAAVSAMSDVRDVATYIQVARAA